jgi:hypothetical protein
MGKCVLCGTQTTKVAWNMETGEFYHLCDTCRDNKYARCSVCGVSYHKDELADGKCERCRGIKSWKD